MTLPASHPHAGTAIRLTEAMTDDTGEVRAMQEDEDMEKATLATRLAKAKDRVEGLEAEVERLQKDIDALYYEVADDDAPVDESDYHQKAQHIGGRINAMRWHIGSQEDEVERLRGHLKGDLDGFERIRHHSDLPEIAGTCKLAEKRLKDVLDGADAERIDPSDHGGEMPPSTDRLQTLPEWARHWIQELETRCDPRRLHTEQQKRRELEAEVERLRKGLEDIQTKCCHPVEALEDAEYVISQVNYLAHDALDGAEDGSQ